MESRNFKSKKTKSFMRNYFNDYENGTNEEEIHYHEDKCFGDNIPNYSKNIKIYLTINKTKTKIENELSKIKEQITKPLDSDKFENN